LAQQSTSSTADTLSTMRHAIAVATSSVSSTADTLLTILQTLARIGIPWCLGFRLCLGIGVALITVYNSRKQIQWDKTYNSKRRDKFLHPPHCFDF
jgi:hypothetical protein